MARKSALVDTRIIHCGDCLDQLRKLPNACIDLIYIDPPFNSNRNYEVFWGETQIGFIPIPVASAPRSDARRAATGFIRILCPSLPTLRLLPRRRWSIR
jgi:hypothetical protein